MIRDSKEYEVAKKFVDGYSSRMSAYGEMPELFEDQRLLSIFYDVLRRLVSRIEEEES